MRLGKWGKFLHLDRVELGIGPIHRFTIFEFKPIGGVIINVYNTISQNRFHTHAFNAVSIMLRGWYEEEIKHRNGLITRRTRDTDIRYLSRHTFHRIMASSPNAVSVTFCGPWVKTWLEQFDDGRKIRYTWGRIKVNQ